MTKTSGMDRKRIRLTIGAKLIFLNAAVLLGSITSLVWIATQMFTQDNSALIQQMNADAAASLSTQMRELLDSLNEKSALLGRVLLSETQDTATKNDLIRNFFAKDKDYRAVFIQQMDNAGEPVVAAKAVSPEILVAGDPEGANALAALRNEKGFSVPAIIQQGAVQIASIVQEDGTPMVAIGLPFIQAGDQFKYALITLVHQSRFVKAFTRFENLTSYLVDRQGNLVAHPDARRVASRENVAHLGIVRSFLEGKTGNGQTRFLDPFAQEWRLGAFQTVGFGGLGVVAEVPELKAFEAADRVRYRSILVAAAILALSFMLGYLYSGTITWPIKQLSEAASRISEGDFKIQLRRKGSDELAYLSGVFNKMALDLENRVRVIETFNKFHNKEIAERLLSGEVKLGGERRQATVFFSDVRGFTALSESMPPEEVVEMLNEYMSRMVAVIRKYKGVVDKYVGDAIMAIWGVPIEQADGAYNAVRACLEMRVELSKLNQERIARGKVPLRIGMGLNCGSVIAGNIGSSEKMEYTIIGDSVNLASRIESMTKEFGTDLLISKDVHEKVKDRFVFESCKSMKVKGKSASVETFKVLGTINEDGSTSLVQTPYSSYEAEKSDKVLSEDPGSDRNSASA